MKEFETFRFEEVEPRVGLVTMNRPEQLNAVNIMMLDEFGELFSLLSKDDAIRVLILTGEGRGFCAGADLNDAVVHKDTEAFSDPENFLRIVQERYAALVLGLRRIPQPSSPPSTARLQVRDSAWPWQAMCGWRRRRLRLLPRLQTLA